MYLTPQLSLVSVKAQGFNPLLISSQHLQSLLCAGILTSNPWDSHPTSAVKDYEARALQVLLPYITVVLVSPGNEEM